MACYFTRKLCASSGTKKPPVAARRKRYYRLGRPVLPLQAALPPPPTARHRKHHSTPQKQAVLPVLQPVLPVAGTTAPSYRSPQAPPTEAPGPQAVLPLRKRYYRIPPVLPDAGPVLPVLPDPDRLSSALCLVTQPIIYLFIPKLPLFCGWTIYSPHPLL